MKYFLNFGLLIPLLFSGISLFSQEIGLAISTNGINFTRISNNPIITNGSNGTWDYLGTNYPSSIIYKDTLRIYYSGMQDSLFNFTPNIGYAYLDSTFTSVYLNNNLDVPKTKKITKTMGKNRQTSRDRTIKRYISNFLNCRYDLISSHNDNNLSL